MSAVPSRPQGGNRTASLAPQFVGDSPTLGDNAAARRLRDAVCRGVEGGADAHRVGHERLRHFATNGDATFGGATDWRRRTHVLPRIPTGSSACGIDHGFAALPAAGYSIPARHVPRRRLHLAARPNLASACHVRYAIPRHHRPLPRSDRRADAQATRGRYAASRPGPDVSQCSKHWPCLFRSTDWAETP